MSTKNEREIFLRKTVEIIRPVIEWLEDNNLNGKIKAKMPSRKERSYLYVEAPLPKHFMGYDILWVN